MYSLRSRAFLRTITSVTLVTLPGLIACGAPDPNRPGGGGDDDGAATGAATGNEDGGSSGTGAAPGSGSTTANGGNGGPGSGGAGGLGSGGSAPISSKKLPARVRRLTNAEYDAAVQGLLGTTAAPASSFPPDSRQQGYTVNEAQRVDPVLALELDNAAEALATEARARFATLAPCQNPTTEGASCANAFIESFGAKAYRRPLEDADKASLVKLFNAGAEGGSYEDGIALVIRGILQSPGFLYLTEIGPGDPTSDVAMTSHEIASALSFLITGGLPDDPLRALAESDDLLEPAVREAETRRLFATEAGQLRAVQMVREWLALDRILQTSKDSTVYPSFGDLRDDMADETVTFVESVLAGSGNVSDLLGATSDTGSSALQAMYEAQGGPERVGLLNQAAFLSIFAHAQETAPVLRGVNVLRRVACQTMELPTSLNIQIVPPVPDPQKTTRERFGIHAQDPICIECHVMIDPIGFSFEDFDAMGAYRSMENNLPVDSSTTIELGLDFDGSYDNSNELAAALASSSVVRDCFGKQIFTANSAEGIDTKGYETRFAELLAELPAEDRGNLLEILVAYAKSDLFIERRAQ